MASALEETIAGQPAALRDVLALDLAVPVDALAGATRVWLVGTGTSQHAAELGAMLLSGGGREVQWRSSAAFAAAAPALGPDDAAIVISHTTETAYAQAARAHVRAAGARLVTITGTGRPWPEAIATVAPERSETYTASYTAAVLVLARLAHALGTGAVTEAALAAVPDQTAAALDAARDRQPALPERLLVITGAGPAGVSAREGALKLREGARVLAEGYEAEYLLHGGAVPLTGADGLLLLNPDADGDGLVGALGQAARAEGLGVSALSAPGVGHPVLDQIPLTASLQTLAALAARARGEDPDTVIVGGWAQADLWALGAPGG